MFDITSGGHLSYNSVQVTPPNATEAALDVKNHPISTLDPSKLSREDYLDISGLNWSSFALVTERDTSLLLRRDAHPSAGPSSQRFPMTRWSQSPLPDHTAGFFYLKKAPQGAPETAAEIRMRITNDPDPSSFASGTDLMQDGLPWRQPARKCDIEWLLSLCKRDDSLSNAAQTQLAHFPVPSRAFLTSFKRTSAVLYSRSQPFVVDFSLAAIRLGLVVTLDGQDIIRRLTFQLPKRKIRVVEGEISHADGKSEGHVPERGPLYTGER